MILDRIAAIDCNRKRTSSSSTTTYNIRRSATNTKYNNIHSSAVESTTTGNNFNISVIVSSASSSSKKRPRKSMTTSASSIDATNEESNDSLPNIHPSEYARKAFQENGFKDLDAISRAADARFLPPTAAMLDAYNTEIVAEVRQNNLERAKRLYADGRFPHGCNACNRFGESILHIACRRGHLEMVKFLVGEVGLSISSIRDDYHRTPLHDAFWTSTANPEVVDYLLQQPHVIELLLCKDKRGFSPLDYSRGEDRSKWLKFLSERKGILRPQCSDRESLADLIENVYTQLSKNEDDSYMSPSKRQRIIG